MTCLTCMADKKLKMYPAKITRQLSWYAINIWLVKWVIRWRLLQRLLASYRRYHPFGLSACSAHQPWLAHCGIFSQLWAIHYTSNPVYTDSYSVTPDRVLSVGVRSRIARPGLRRIKGGGYQRGPHRYTQEEVDNTFTLGIKAKLLENKKKNRHLRLESLIERFKRDIEEIKKEERADLNEYKDNIPWNDTNMLMEHFNNDVI